MTEVLAPAPTQPLRSVARRDLPVLAGFALAVFVLHVATSNIWGFHRDELLYVSLGRHLAWGYWSNPPLIGFLGTIQGLVPGSGPWLIRIIPALASSAVVVTVGLMAHAFGGRRSAVVLACLSTLLSPALVRIGVLFQPVIMDVLFWTLFTYAAVRYLNTEQPRWVWMLGAVLGIGMMNKYLIALVAISTLIVLPFTRHRSLFASK
ncbi:MAG TPA: glycosyltransferase family 39 protein, partial [Rhodothermales bacterium]